MSPLPVSLPFTDRSEAGSRLAERVRDYAVTDPIVLALPRGGVPVGAELARALGAPLDVLMVRKLGLPGHSEMGVGAVTEDGQVCFDDNALARLHVSRDQLRATVEAERAELGRRLEAYRGHSPAPRIAGRDVLVVDDGIATGGTARAALRMVRRQQPARVVAAIPVGAQSAVESLRPEADHVVVLTAPENFRAVGEWYRDFGQLSDDDVTRTLTELRGLAPATGSDARTVHVPVGTAELEGELTMPPDVRGGVVVALGRGEDGPRRQAFTAAMRDSGYATLIVDPSHPREGAESETGGEEPAERGRKLGRAAAWLRETAEVSPQRIGVFGSGPGAPAALVAAAAHPDEIAAVVVHGGRIDAAEGSLARVRAPVLVLVEGEDSFVRELAEWVVSRLGAPCELRTVAGAEQLLATTREWRAVADSAAEWFTSRM
ncbi:phosphoribosyltransferase family protein [Haloactinospora alba]|nr:phosphoribosyltransferase family protein [Haloactinospora alba]